MSRDIYTCLELGIYPQLVELIFQASFLMPGLHHHRERGGKKMTLILQFYGSYVRGAQV